MPDETMESAEVFVKEKWQLLTAFYPDEAVKETLWSEILYRYTERHRYYHNLNHVGYLFSLCDKYLSHIRQPAVVGFALLYHDIIYDTYRTDNEAQSAELAGIHLKKIKLNASLITQVQQFILATKDHEMKDDVVNPDDLALFLDFDMAILGEEPGVYGLYSQKIRKEYAKYSDVVYKEGRKLALSKMLEMSLFKTELFQQSHHEQAMHNMRREMASL